MSRSRSGGRDQFAVEAAERPSFTANCILIVGGSMARTAAAGVLRIGEGLADKHVVETGHADDVAGVRFGISTRFIPSKWKIAVILRSPCAHHRGGRPPDRPPSLCAHDLAERDSPE